ncbi:MAG TPA: hypothetical protein VD866_13335 [Urbifossiella sp.]|nr:hypothetical protein [Urbifossiella sp.]
MVVPIVVGPYEAGFRARTGSPLDLTADGPTADDAVTALQSLVADRLRTVELRAIDVPDPPAPAEPAPNPVREAVFQGYLEEVARIRSVTNTIPDDDE